MTVIQIPLIFAVFSAACVVAAMVIVHLQQRKLARLRREVERLLSRRPEMPPGRNERIASALVAQCGQRLQALRNGEPAECDLVGAAAMLLMFAERDQRKLRAVGGAS